MEVTIKSTTSIVMDVTVPQCGKACCVLWMDPLHQACRVLEQCFFFPPRNYTVEIKTKEINVSENELSTLFTDCNL